MTGGPLQPGGHSCFRHRLAPNNLTTRKKAETRLQIDLIKVTITILINIHEMFSVLIFSMQQDATEMW